MKAEDFLDAPSPSSKGSAEAFLGAAPATPAPKPEPNTVFGEVPGHMFRAALGILEQPAVGLYALGTSAYATSVAGTRAIAAKLAGLPLGETFHEEYKAAQGDMPEFVPLTPTGAKITETVSHVLEQAVQAVGDTMYKAGGVKLGSRIGKAQRPEEDIGAGSPAMGALGQAGAMLAAMLAPIPGMKGKEIGGKPKPGTPKPGEDPIAAFERDFPRTADAIDASHVGKGKVSTEPLDPTAPAFTTSTKTVMQAVGEALDKELGIPSRLNRFVVGKDEFDVLAAAKNMTLSDKMKLLIMKYGGAEVPPGQAQLIANAYAERFQTLQATQDAVIAQRPKLPDPSKPRTDLTVEVDSQGVARTMPQQQVRQMAYDAEAERFKAWQNEREATLSGKPTFKKQQGSIEVDGIQQNVEALKGMVEDATVKGFIARDLNEKERTYFKHADEAAYQDFIEQVPSAVFEHDRIVASKAHEEQLKNVLDYIASDKDTPFVPKGQRGSIEVDNIPVGPETKKLIASPTPKGVLPPPKDETQIVASVQRALDNSYTTMAEKAKVFSIDAIKAARRAIVSHDYDLQADLKKAGPLGERAMLRMNVQHNANMIAKVRADKATRAIFDDLNKGETKVLEEIIRLRRIAQIDEYKGEGTVRHEVDPMTGRSITGGMAKIMLNAMERKQPDFGNLDSKATAYFTEEKANLRRLLDEGLLSETEFDKMKRLDYSRTQHLDEYIDVIDPSIPNAAQSVRGSGIPFLGAGKSNAVNMDAKRLMQEDIARVENRISKNNTLKALNELAKQQPENGIVMKPKHVDKKGRAKIIPDGWTEVGVMVAGKQESILMRNDYALQFTARNDAGLNTSVWSMGNYDVTVGSIVRTASGASLLRATATTYNPSFSIFAGLPMDILHVWLATKDIYNPHLPVYMMQMAHDLITTRHDAFYRTGRWEQAMIEGMGPNFLTHETRALTGPESFATTMTPALQKTKKALAFFGDFADMWVRLAHRERLMRQGVDSETATAMAVERLNYFRGGVLGKFVDSYQPYTAIAINATSKVIENSAAAKQQAAVKVGWIVGALSAATLANMIASPETHKAISTNDKVRNVIISFGDQWFFIDPDGNKRYMYAQIRLDQTAMPFNAAIVAGLEAAEYGTVPDGIMSKAIGQVNPLSTTFVPTYQAIREYVDNYDTYKDNPIYQGMKIKPEDEIRTFAKGKPTSALAKGVGSVTGLSPMRLEKAAGALVYTDNPFFQVMGGAYKALFEGMDPREQSQSTMEALQRVPGLRFVVKFTTPGTELMKQVDKKEREVNSVLFKSIQGLDDLIFQYNQKKGGVDLNIIKGFIQGQPEESRQHLVDHLKYSVNVDRVMKQYKASEGIPQRGWWITTSKINPQARAEVFYSEWISASAEDRKRMMAIAGSLHELGTGYMSEAFQRRFMQEKKRSGLDHR